MDLPALISALGLVFGGLTWVVVILRFYTRAIKSRNLGHDDWTMLACQVFFSVYMALQSAGVAYGTGRHRWDLSDEQAEIAMKLWFLCELAYLPATVLLKVSVGLFILRFALDKPERLLLKGTMVGSILFGIAYFFVLLFQCHPISYWWAAGSNPDGWCMRLDAFLGISYAAAAMNMLADLVFALVPVLIVWRTQMKTRIRIQVCILLGVASIAIVATIIRIPFANTYAAAFEKPSDFLYVSHPITYLSSTEIGLGILASSLATLRQLFGDSRTDTPRAVNRVIESVHAAPERKKSCWFGHKKACRQQRLVPDQFSIPKYLDDHVRLPASSLQGLGVRADRHRDLHSKAASTKSLSARSAGTGWKNSQNDDDDSDDLDHNQYRLTLFLAEASSKTKRCLESIGMRSGRRSLPACPVLTLDHEQAAPSSMKLGNRFMAEEIEKFGLQPHDQLHQDLGVDNERAGRASWRPDRGEASSHDLEKGIAEPPMQ